MRDPYTFESFTYVNTYRQSIPKNMTLQWKPENVLKLR